MSPHILRNSPRTGSSPSGRDEGPAARTLLDRIAATVTPMRTQVADTVERALRAMVCCHIEWCDCSEGDCGCASETAVLPRGGADSWDLIAAAVAATTDRATTSREIVDRLTAGSGGDRTLSSVTLPDRYRIDETRLNRRLTTLKVRQRRRAGLPIPAHAVDYTNWGANPAQMGPPRLLDHRMAPPSLWGPDDESRSDLPYVPAPGQTRVSEYTARATYVMPDPVDRSTMGAWTLLRGDAVVPHRVAVLGWWVAALLLGLSVLLLALTHSPVAAVPAAAMLVIAAGSWWIDERRLELQFNDWCALERATVTAPSPAPGTIEYRLAVLAHLVCAAITARPVWESDFLTDHRLQFDPRAEADELAAQASRISTVRARIEAGPIDGHGPAADEARYQRAADHAVLETVTSSLSDRVATLLRYAADIHLLDAEYQALQMITQSLLVRADLDELVEHTGTNTVATGRMARLTTDADAARFAIETHLRGLSTDLTLLAN